MNFEIVILSFNHPELTSRAVESAISLHSAERIHLIHNGSTAQNQQLLQDKFPGIQHHILLNNQGFTGGTNFALATVFQLSEWCLFLTNDCVLEDLATIDAPPGLYAPKIFRRNTGKVDSHGAFFAPKSLQLWHHTENALPDAMPGQFFYVPGTAFVMHRKVFATVGTFETALNTYWEDVDYSVKTANHGFPVAPIDGFKIRHAVGKTCHKLPHYTNYLFQRNRYRVSRRHGASRLTVLRHATQRVLGQMLKRNWPKAKQSIKAYLDA